MRRLLIMAAALAAAILLPSAAHAAFPGENGKIVFDGVWVANSPKDDASRLRWRDRSFKGLIILSHPEIAPDGRGAVVTVTNWEKERVTSQFLGLLTLDGTVQTRLLDWPLEWGALGGGTFSPDGKRIAFDVHTSRDPTEPRSIFVMDSDGTDVEKLTDGFDPAFSPDGDRIVFSRYEEGPSDNPAFGLYTIAPNGGGEQRLGSGSDPDYAPDGERIVFVDNLAPRSDECGEIATVSVMAADGSNVRHLRKASDTSSCDERGSYHSPSFSPNGRMILFVKSRGGIRPFDEVHVMRPDGSNERVPFPEAGSNIPGVTFVGTDWGPRQEGEPAARCSKLRATIAGTKLTDQIFGTHGHDVIQAGRGDDVVRGGKGSDRICGGPGDDHIKAHKGPDRLVGGPGNDILRGNQGRDALFGAKGFDRCFGGKGRDAARCEREKSAS